MNPSPESKVPSPERTRRGESVAVGPPGGWRGGEQGLVLAIDTSTRVGGVALCRGDQLLGEDTWQAGGHQTRQVLPAAARLWERAGCTVRDLALVVVATGPGSFTGLRVGVSLAKGLCLPLGIPLVGVPTLDALAYQLAAGTASARLVAVVDAGRGHYYAGTYAARGDQLRREGSFAVVTADELPALVHRSRGAVVVGGELDEIGLVLASGTGPTSAKQGHQPWEESRRAGDKPPRYSRLSEAGAARGGAVGRVRVLPAAWGVRRAGFLAELGRWVLATEGPAEAALLQPLYLRRAPDGK